MSQYLCDRNQALVEKGSSNVYYQAVNPNTKKMEICHFEPDESFCLKNLEQHPRYANFKDIEGKKVPALIIETTVSQKIEDAIAKFDIYFSYEGCRVGKQLIFIFSLLCFIY